jgi:hypothetical protein
VVEAEAAVQTAAAPAADLQDACLIVRTRSENPDAHMAADRLAHALSLGMH